VTAIPKRVAIFGAGVSGLTAAHELIERGFRVRVYENTPPGPEEEICGIGGMARTQYSWVETPPEEFDQRDRSADLLPQPKRKGGPAPMKRARPVTERRYDFLYVRVRFPPKEATLSARARKTLDGIVDFLEETAPVSVWIRGHDSDPKLVPDFAASSRRKEEPTANARIDLRRAWAVKRHLVKRGIAESRLWTVPLGYRAPLTPTDDTCYVDFQIEDELLPGEHGFRFFPSFYRHVFDTMKRIPLGEGPGMLRESGRTVEDNLVATTEQNIAYEETGTYTFPRRVPTSLKELGEAIARSFQHSRTTVDDAARLQAKIVRYMTSCPERRKTYESQSWWDFIEGDGYSKPCRKYLDSSPQMLVAMRAKASDARTIGNITVQIFADQLRHGERTDRTLRGPTSSTWLAPWRRYLVRQGVEFVRGELLSFNEVGRRVMALVQEVKTTRTDGTRTETRPTRAIDFDYYVVATSVQAAQRIARASRFAPCEQCDVDRLLKMPLGRDDVAKPGGWSEHMSGIQFYFRSEVSFAPGHTVYPDSAWGLSSIAQPQFWTTRRGWWDGYRGLLSVDIGNWHAKGSKGPSAWDSSPEEIAEEVWGQIIKTFVHPPERPVFYHLDQNIRMDPESGKGKRNVTPMLINKPGSFHRRPGSLYGYHVHGKQLVFAGTYMQTRTRLTCMESANESARLAVTAILRQENFLGDQPKTFDPEEFEIPDLHWLVQLDRRLFLDKAPHVLDILGEDIPIGLAKGAATGLALLAGAGVKDDRTAQKET
jgi:uncharacterized protein with NAD-binding domain and iron-sulfur cluster/outer membrane protein OmpA-like peptidoglycan-associated protein